MAIRQAKRPVPDKKTPVDHLNTTKTLLENATTTGIVGGITTALRRHRSSFPEDKYSPRSSLNHDHESPGWATYRH